MLYMTMRVDEVYNAAVPFAQYFLRLGPTRNLQYTKIATTVSQTYIKNFIPFSNV